MSKPTTMKQTPSNLPPIADAPPISAAVIEKEIEEVASITGAVMEEVFKEPETVSASLVVPICATTAHKTRNINLFLSTDQAAALVAVISGLQHQKARLKNGTIVTRGCHGIQWILENLMIEKVKK